MLFEFAGRVQFFYPQHYVVKFVNISNITLKKEEEYILLLTLS